MNLVEYELSSDEEENEKEKEKARIFSTAETEKETDKGKEKDKVKGKEKDNEKEKEKEKRTRWDDSHNKNNDSQMSKNENKNNKNTFDKYTYRKQNVDKVKIKSKEKFYNEKVLGENDFNSKEYKRRKVENDNYNNNYNNMNDGDKLKEKIATSNESLNNYKNSEHKKKTENNLKKSGRISRWDNAYSTKVLEETNLIENVKDIKNVTKVETVSSEIKDSIVNEINSGKREQKQEEELQQEQERKRKEKEKERKVDDESAFFENTHLMNIDINENNFEDVFEQMPNEYSSYIDKKINELKKLYDMGLTINKRISESNEYKNPCILEKIMNIFEIEEYASNYPLHIFNPKDLDAVDLFHQHEKNTYETMKKSSRWSSRN